MKTRKSISPRTLARFQRAAAQYGGKVLCAKRDLLGIHMVFDGQDGGWTVKLSFDVGWDYRIVAIGRNIKETIQDIKDQGTNAMKMMSL